MGTLMLSSHQKTLTIKSQSVRFVSASAQAMQETVGHKKVELKRQRHDDVTLVSSAAV